MAVIRRNELPLGLQNLILKLLFLVEILNKTLGGHFLGPTLYMYIVVILVQKCLFVAVQLGLRPNVSQTAHIYNKRVGNLVWSHVLHSSHRLLRATKAVSHFYLVNGGSGRVERIHIQLLRLRLGPISLRNRTTSGLPILCFNIFLRTPSKLR